MIFSFDVCLLPSVLVVVRRRVCCVCFANLWCTKHVKQLGFKNRWNVFGAGTPAPAEEAVWQRRCGLLAPASGLDLYTKIYLPVQKKPKNRLEGASPFTAT